jgi:hypothetical protein
MYVEIFSIMSAVAGKPAGTTWQGNLDCEGANGKHEGMLCIIFRLLNLVDDNDLARLTDIGYFLPSLSVGDFVTMHVEEQGEHGPGEYGLVTRPYTYRVDGVGFTKVTGNRDFIPFP